MHVLIYGAVLALTFLMVIAKRYPALIRCFRYQSFFLFLATLSAALREKQIELYLVSGLIILVKVCLIPYILNLTAKKIKVDENLGFFLNPQLSLILSLLFTYYSWILANHFGLPVGSLQIIAVCVAFSVIFSGAFLMIFRMKAFTQIVGIMVMENGIFLFASSVTGGMPFFAEIVIFFDVFVSVIIMGLFVYRINALFTHLDVNKLSQLKG